MSSVDSGAAWTLVTGHGRVLVAIAKNPQARVRDLALEAGLTERTTQAIVADLEVGGYITRRRVGRRTQYAVHAARGFRQRTQDNLAAGPFLDLLTGLQAGEGQPPRSGAGHDPARAFGTEQARTAEAGP